MKALGISWKKSAIQRRKCVERRMERAGDGCRSMREEFGRRVKKKIYRKKWKG